MLTTRLLQLFMAASLAWSLWAMAREPRADAPEFDDMPEIRAHHERNHT